MADDLTAIPGQKKQQGRAGSFKRALDANIDGIPSSPSMRKAIASKAKTKQGTTAIEGTVVRMGAPSKYTEELANKICELFADGVTERELEKMEGMPSAETIRRWKRDNESFRGQYARAMEESADSLVDEALHIGRRTLSGSYDPLAARVFIDQIKWTAGKRKPKVYGDKLDLTSDNKALPQPLFGGVSITTDVKQLKADT